MRSRFMPFCTRMMKMAPRTTFGSRPVPPKRLTPPITQAAIESSGYSLPMFPSPLSRRAVSMMAPMVVIPAATT